MDQSQWPVIESYVKDFITTFKDDARILAWDLYNEPGNFAIFKADGKHDFDQELEKYSEQLMEKVFAWAREIIPTHPLTVGGWHVHQHWIDEKENIHKHAIDIKAFEHSDIITFHVYSPVQILDSIIHTLKKYNCPILCTEWLARHVDSTIHDQLPVFHQEKIGCYHWGLVNGKTQTHIPWPNIMKNDTGDAQWFHDVLHADGTPYSKAEIEIIRKLTHEL